MLMENNPIRVRDNTVLFMICPSVKIHPKLEYRRVRAREQRTPSYETLRRLYPWRVAIAQGRVLPQPTRRGRDVRPRGRQEYAMVTRRPWPRTCPAPSCGTG